MELADERLHGWRLILGAAVKSGVAQHHPVR